MRFDCLGSDEVTMTDNTDQNLTSQNTTNNTTYASQTINQRDKPRLAQSVEARTPKGGRVTKQMTKQKNQEHISYQHGLKVMYTNTDQLKNKVDEMMDRIDIINPDIIAVNEVKPKAPGKYSMSDFIIDRHSRYEIFENNIDSDIGRGQLVLVKKCWKTKQVQMSTDFSENILIEIKLDKKDKLLVALIYRSESEGEEMSRQLVKLTDEICSKGYSHILFMGDYNYRNINWDGLDSKDKIEQKFLKCIADNYLHQHIQEPTRWRGSNIPSLLDLVLTNEESMVMNLDVQGPVGNSDHAVIVFKFNCYAEETTETYTKIKYHQAKLSKMKEHLNTVDWSPVTNGKDKNDMESEFLKVYNTLIERYVPIVKKKCNIKNQMPLDEETRKLIKIKSQKSRKVMRMKHKNKSDAEIAAAKVEYNRARNKVRKMTRNKRKAFEMEIAAGVKKNNKRVFAYMNRRSKTKSGIGDICINPGNSKSTKTSNPKKKAEIFSDYFASVWTEEPPGELPVFMERNVSHSMPEIIINEDVVLQKLKALNASKSPDSDGVHPFILKNLAEELVVPITAIYKVSLEEKKLPIRWKNSSITVIYKKGDKSLAGNYRPVSLTSILCKILETIIRENMMVHMLKNDLFTNKQYGFISGRSAALQLLKMMNGRSLLTKAST